MKVKTDVELKTLSGEAMKDADEKGNAINAKIKNVLINALLAPVQSEKGVDKIEKYELAKKIYAADEVELSAEDISLIKARVGEMFPPLVVGQVYDLLEDR